MIQLHQYLAGFNHSTWNALVALTPVWGFVAAKTIYSAVKQSDVYYYFDAKHYLAGEITITHKGQRRREDTKPGDEISFKEHSARYQDLGKLIITLSAGAIAFLVNTLVNQKAPTSQAALRLIDVCPIVVGLFGCSIAFIVIFFGLQAIWYEQYSYSANHDSYSAWKYELSSGLGLGGGIAFLAGFGWLAANLF